MQKSCMPITVMYLPCKLYANVLPNLLVYEFKLVADFSGVLNQKAFSADLDAGLWLSLFLKTDKVLGSSRGFSCVETYI